MNILYRYVFSFKSEKVKEVFDFSGVTNIKDDKK